LKVYTVQASLLRLESKSPALSKTHTVRHNMKSMEADAFRVANGIKKNGRNCRFPTREQNVDLSLRLKRKRVAENDLYVFDAQFVNVAGSVRIHEAGRTHHVAPVGQINNQQGSSTGSNAVWAMTVHVAVVDTLKVPAESKAFHLSKEIRMVGECVLERAMPLAGLPQEDASALLQYLGFNDSGVVPESGDIHFAPKDCFHCFLVAVRA
jgi:hypothetical protein